MIDIAKYTEKFKPASWQAGLYVLGLAIVVASLASVGVGHFLLPMRTKPSTPLPAKPAPRDLAIDAPLDLSNRTLSKAGVDAIIKRNIFNSDGATGDDKPDKPATGSRNAIKCDLPIKLVGTIFGGTPFNGIALIENTGKNTIDSFVVGDVLLKEATIKEIYEDRIFVDRGGQREYVELFQHEIKHSSRQHKTPAPVAAVANADPGFATQPPPESYKEDGFERTGNDMTMSQSYRDRLLTQDFTKVLQDAKATPNMVGNELKGFELERIRKDSIYEKAGLTNGDVIEEINGVPLNDTAKTIQFLNTLRGENQIEFRVKRNGTEITKVLNVR